MNKTLKWVLIGLAIAVVVFLIALVCFVGFKNGFGGMMGRSGEFGRLPGRGGNFNRLPMMGGGGMMFGLGILMFFRAIIPLGILALAVVGIVLLFRNKRASSASKKNQLPAETPVVTTHSCAKCGKDVQNEWAVCPYCGKKQ